MDSVGKHSTLALYSELENDPCVPMDSSFLYLCDKCIMYQLIIKLCYETYVRFRFPFFFSFLFYCIKRLKFHILDTSYCHKENMRSGCDDLRPLTFVFLENFRY